MMRILLLLLLVGPTVGSLLPAPDALCQETQDCCGPDGLCDMRCTACGCCTTHFTPTTTTEPRVAPLGPATLRATAAPLPPPPTDILHVPRSR